MSPPLWPNHKSLRWVWKRALNYRPLRVAQVPETPVWLGSFTLRSGWRTSPRAERSVTQWFLELRSTLAQLRHMPLLAATIPTEASTIE